MTQSYRQIIAAVAAVYPKINSVYVTSTTGGGHAPGSWHYSGNAVDYGASTQAAKDDLAAFLYQFPGKYFRELIHTRRSLSLGGWYIKNGSKGYRYSVGLRIQHINHVHLAMTLADVHGWTSSPEYRALLTSTPTLRLGATGQPVAKLQASLNTAGAIPILTVDGSFGPATEAAVKVFQTTHGLVPDGVVGPKTWTALGA